MASQGIGKGRKEILRQAGWPERMWEPAGYDKKGNKLWASRPATNREWEARWEEYNRQQEGIMDMREAAAND